MPTLNDFDEDWEADDEEWRNGFWDDALGDDEDDWDEDE